MNSARLYLFPSLVLQALVCTLALCPGASGKSSSHFRTPPSAPVKISPSEETSYDPSEVIIAVIDTGVDLNHKTLKGNIGVSTASLQAAEGIKNRANQFGWDFINNSPNPEDKNGHGTHVAGIIASVLDHSMELQTDFSTRLRKIRIMPLKYYSDTNSGAANLDFSVKAIHYAIEHGAKIINYSGGGPGFSDAEFKAIQKAESQGILFIAAAGNEHQNTDERSQSYYPSSYRMHGVNNIISVAATDHRNQLLATSNWGLRTIDVAAPGERIYSTLPRDQFGFMSGTSQATAYVTGIAALILSRHPDLSPQRVREILVSSVDPLPQLRGKIKSGGKVNVSKALISLRNWVAPHSVWTYSASYRNQSGHPISLLDQLIAPLREINGLQLPN